MLVVIYISTIVFICFHEYIHGFVAGKLGDPTVSSNKRDTLNLLAHMDVLGTCCLPLVLLLTAGFLPIGYAKPIPVNPGQLRYPRRDTLKICLSAPFANLILGLVFGLLYTINFFWLGSIWIIFAIINIYLFIFNLLPFAPLDGARILMILWPTSIMEKYFSNRWLSFFFFGIFIMSGGFKYFITPLVRGILFIVGIRGAI